PTSEPSLSAAAQRGAMITGLSASSTAISSPTGSNRASDSGESASLVEPSGSSPSTPASCGQQSCSTGWQLCPGGHCPSGPHGCPGLGDGEKHPPAAAAERKASGSAPAAARRAPIVPAMPHLNVWPRRNSRPDRHRLAAGHHLLLEGIDRGVRIERDALLVTFPAAAAPNRRELDGDPLARARAPRDGPAAKAAAAQDEAALGRAGRGGHDQRGAAEPLAALQDGGPGGPGLERQGDRCDALAGVARR